MQNQFSFSKTIKKIFLSLILGEGGGNSNEFILQKLAKFPPVCGGRHPCLPESRALSPAERTSREQERGKICEAQGLATPCRAAGLPPFTSGRDA
jgi:hypothetical protein